MRLTPTSNLAYLFTFEQVPMEQKSSKRQLNLIMNSHRSYDKAWNAPAPTVCFPHTNFFLHMAALWSTEKNNEQHATSCSNRSKDIRKETPREP
ncbi:hypothetical protein TNCT_126051 [Trichonephila clavata]|uniref:Uncharacterized protein n=1 Tax=Trichonephila clavata TaxID=2740835 RepID=A0A8X6KC13_TRICU|nr:hypothetical protein TNCT_126051 [Trichonephila clavata]